MKKLGMSYNEMNDREEESSDLQYDQSQQSLVGEKINNRDMIRLLKK